MRATALLLLLGAACDGDCPGTPLEVLPFEGDEVIGTAAQCEGELVALWGPCYEEGRAAVILDPTFVGDCDEIAIGINIPFVGVGLALWLGDGSARGHAVYRTDQEGDAMDLPPVVSGQVSPMEMSRAGRNRGRYQLVFDGATITGTYDTAPP